MVETLPNRDAVVDTLEHLGFEWEIRVDEDEGREYLFARNTIDGINVLISCKPAECKVEAPEYRVASPCYSKPAPIVVKCVDVVISRVKEVEENTRNLMQIAEKLVEYGFKVSAADGRVLARKPVDGGEIEIVFSPPGFESTLKLEIRARSPVKLAIIAMEELSKLQLL
jgi:hypothetical protein